MSKVASAITVRGVDATSVRIDIRFSWWDVGVTAYMAATPPRKGRGILIHGHFV